MCPQNGSLAMQPPAPHQTAHAATTKSTLLLLAPSIREGEAKPEVTLLLYLGASTAGTLCSTGSSRIHHCCAEMGLSKLPWSHQHCAHGHLQPSAPCSAGIHPALTTPQGHGDGPCVPPSTTQPNPWREREGKSKAARLGA